MNFLENLILKDRSKQKLFAFMEIAKNISTLSYDEKYKVGSIIITNDFREICSIGYNGNYKGGPNKRDSIQIGNSGFLHSEENALFHLSKPYELRNGLILICTHKPCSMCAKRIVNSGINNVVYNEFYEDNLKQTDEIFFNAKINCLQI